ncbi:polysaccharide biosynthesis/export family protein [Sphingomonas sp. DT-51]|uniref:polysaccharide biosynthesis/export family protein n=1 Tax=Sphingomonas sp. DT-51 TaxID=3396165 RepID=UPI003F1D0639
MTSFDRYLAGRSALVALAPALLMVSGCAGPTQFGGVQDLHVVQSQTLPPPQTADLAALDRPYRVGPFDKLSIDVYGINELRDREIQVDASGRISFPLVGTVEVSGRTPGEIEDAIEGRLRTNFIRNPQVTVNLKETVSQVVTIGGEVKKPGLFPVIGRMTLMRAIATAEGTTEFARKKEVVVFRVTGGQKYAALYDLRAVERGNYPDPEIYANDVIIVGDSPARRIFKDFLNASPLIAPLIIYGLN